MTAPKSLAPGAYLPGNLAVELDLAAPIGLGGPKKQARWVQERLCLAGFGLRGSQARSTNGSCGTPAYPARSGRSRRPK